MTLREICSFVSCQCWAIRPEAIDRMVARLAHFAAHGRPDAAKTPPVKAVSGGVTVIPIRSEIIHRADPILEEWFGLTSSERLVANVNKAVNDPTIAAIVLDIDSPGGTVSGLEEASAAIYEARGKKPVVAVANAEAFSAAYYLGSSASQFFAIPSGMVGSIGTIWPHVEYSKALADEGITVTVIRAGENKARMNILEPLTDSARDEAQAIVDGYYADFVRDVARNRGVRKSEVESKFGKGSIFRASEAADRGMIDGVFTMEQVLGKMMSRKQTGSKADEPGGTPTDNLRRRLELTTAETVV